MNVLTVLLQAPAGAAGGGSMMWIMLIAMFVIMYFFMIRPQQKKQKALQEARNAIKVGDKVVTAGGVHGKVREVGDTFFIVEIAENVKIKIEKASVYVSAEDTQTK